MPVGIMPVGILPVGILPVGIRLDAPIDNGTFVRPIKQCFIKILRLLPGTKTLFSLLAGWGGHDAQNDRSYPGRHPSRSTRQIYRYLIDAREEGYLFWTQTVNRSGYVNGVKIWLNFAAIFAGKREKKPKTLTIQAKTLVAETNENIYIDRGADERFQKKLVAICERNGIDPPSLIPNQKNLCKYAALE